MEMLGRNEDGKVLQDYALSFKAGQKGLRFTGKPMSVEAMVIDAVQEEIDHLRHRRNMKLLEGSTDGHPHENRGHYQENMDKVMQRSVRHRSVDHRRNVTDHHSDVEK